MDETTPAVETFPTDAKTNTVLFVATAALAASVYVLYRRYKTEVTKITAETETAEN